MRIGIAGVKKRLIITRLRSKLSSGGRVVRFSVVSGWWSSVYRGRNRINTSDNTERNLSRANLSNSVDHLEKWSTSNERESIITAPNTHASHAVYIPDTDHRVQPPLFEAQQVHLG